MEKKEKKCQIHLIFTNATTGLCLYNPNEHDVNKEVLNHNNHNYRLYSGTDSIYRHLYITSDDEIKEGDWYIKGSLISQKQFSKTIIPSDSKKIIATTDKSLTPEYLPKQEAFIGIPPKKSIVQFPNKNRLPQPSDSFINVFIDEYNKGNVIKEVMVEYESIGKMKSSGIETSIINILKVNPKDNTITIRKIKDSFTFDEMCINMQYYMEYCQIHKYVTPQKWLSDLKHF